MKKIKLNLEKIKVESFETVQPNSGMGTVKGFRPPPTEDDICKTLAALTCEYTCKGNTCLTCVGYTCDNNIGTCCIHC